jgi:hypothetical protein
MHFIADYMSRIPKRVRIDTSVVITQQTMSDSGL